MMGTLSKDLWDVLFETVHVRAGDEIAWDDEDPDILTEDIVLRQRRTGHEQQAALSSVPLPSLT